MCHRGGGSVVGTAVLVFQSDQSLLYLRVQEATVRARADISRADLSHYRNLVVAFKDPHALHGGRTDDYLAPSELSHPVWPS